ncbi:hypothetical protein C5B96_15250 [Subtercola sp. Z020]|uniref:hypothetical protein n=1 Tax=Subtercola sp. Z020 TaxID=2080582 RepID=UPI000CE92904|nr:hypothetical protein [Subtercola sp. Z020]PPF77689.1 hypothetical protein C5B96_15250 [Subtercola sp. Z020]
MERIHYAGGSVLTGTEIARALLEYAGALASTESSATVDIPCRHDDGSLGRANFLIGPASQLVSETEPSDAEELVEPELIEMFAKETAALTGGGVVRPSEPLGRTEDFDDL